MKKHALNIAAFVWGVAEATLFFIVPDVLLSYIGVRHSARATARASLIAAIGAACGGVILYLWSQADPTAAIAAVSAVPAISDEMMAVARNAMTENWFYATVLGPLTSTPYKVFAVYAPHAGVPPLWAFAIGSVFARLPRFLLVGLGSGVIADALRRRVSERVILIILAVSWIAFYTLFFMVFTREPNIVLN
jgi:hypothetical protein